MLLGAVGAGGLQPLCQPLAAPYCSHPAACWVWAAPDLQTAPQMSQLLWQKAGGLISSCSLKRIVSMAGEQEGEVGMLVLLPLDPPVR